MMPGLCFQLLMAQSFEYATTHDPKAKAAAWKSVRAMEFLHNVTGTPGFSARAAVSTKYCSTVRGARLRDRGGGHTLSCTTKIVVSGDSSDRLLAFAGEVWGSQTWGRLRTVQRTRCRPEDLRLGELHGVLRRHRRWIYTLLLAVEARYLFR